MAGRESFEVQIHSDKRWTVIRVHDGQADAIADAQASLKQRRDALAVRVIRSWLRADGQSTEKEVFAKKQDNPGKPVHVAAIDEAPWCAGLDDLYALPARRTLGRLLRSYLDSVFLTPTELLHSHRALKPLLAHDTLLPAALDRVATLQAQSAEAPPGTDARLRKEELFRLADQVSARAKRLADDGRLPECDGENLAGLMAGIARVAAPEECPFLVRGALAAYLGLATNWDAKLDRLLALFTPDLPPEGAAILDEILAEVLDAASVLHELLGPQPDLGAALGTIARLAAGKMRELPRPPIGPMAQIDALLAAGRVPICRSVLVERVRRELKSGRRLGGNGNGEGAAFAALFALLHDGQGTVPEGLEMLEAILDRASRVFAPPDQPADPHQTLNGLAGLLAEAKARIRFLAGLAGTGFGAKHGDLVAERLGNVILPIKEIHELCYFRDTPKKKMTDVTALERVLLTAPLPEAPRRRLVDKLDDLLAEFIKREGIIEKLDHPDDSLKVRADRLVQFCASGLLIDGKALAIARERTQALLRQPDFVAKYAAAVGDPRQAEAALRHFHALLTKAGFSAQHLGR